MGHKTTQRSSFYLVAMLCVVLFPWAATWGQGVPQVSFSAKINDGTCSVSLEPNAINFKNVIASDFSVPGTTTEIQSLQLTLKDCQGLPDGSLKAGITTVGGVASFDPYLYRDSSSTSDGVGVLLRAEKYTDKRDFYDTSKAVISGGRSYELAVGSAPVSGKVLDYSLGFTNGNGHTSVTPGKLVATLTFRFSYH
ncbi:fimbrial protein [Serratia marcescens]|uniref:fimbrial protein n=1 Tax=Serratia marcescens TaxID=615 RepID=UPI0021788CF1|nr:fimbrial protein [Serratia marcescens]CAI1616307.1 putative fimbrial protein StaE [Serratia marcescens]